MIDIDWIAILFRGSLVFIFGTPILFFLVLRPSFSKLLKLDKKHKLNRIKYVDLLDNGAFTAKSFPMDKTWEALKESLHYTFFYCFNDLDSEIPDILKYKKRVRYVFIFIFFSSFVYFFIFLICFSYLVFTS